MIIRKIPAILSAGLITGVTSLPAAAIGDTSEINQSNYAKSYHALDLDGNGALNQAEAGKEKLFVKNFAAADSNNDGALSEEEYTNYRSNVERKYVKRVASDSVITSKVKANLLKEEGFKSLKINVKTYQGVVLLSGFVESEAQISQAEKVAKGIEGVTSVKNNLVLKKE